MGKYGTDYTGFAAYEGGVNNDKGSNLVATNSDGESSLLFGPAALREIQTGVANGDWAIPPDAATTNISADNPLPYWTFTDTSSAGAITCKSIAQSGGNNAIEWTVALNTVTSKSAQLTRYVPLPAAGGRSYAFFPELYIAQVTSGGSNAARVALSYQYYTAAGATTGTGDTVYMPFSSLTTTARSLTFTSNLTRTAIPADAASMLVTIAVETTGTITTAASVVAIQECRLVSGSQQVLIPDTTSAASYAPTRIYQDNGILYVYNNSSGATSPRIEFGNNLSLPFTVATYDRGGSADTTTITTAGTYYALTNAEASFTPGWIGQRWLLTFTGYASLNTTVIQYCFVRANVTDSSNSIIGSDLGFTRADNFGTSGRGATVAFTKVWTADAAAARKFKLYGTVQTTNGLVLSLAYTQMTAYPIG